MPALTPTALKAAIDANIAANGVGGITGPVLNSVLTDYIDSFKDWTAWAEYRDDQYTDIAPFSVAGDTDTILPNNGLDGVKTYEPSVDLYDLATQKINGRIGEAMLVTIDFDAVPTNPAANILEWWLNIGGAVGELYRRPFSFPKGSGIVRHISFTQFVYTLDTWAANGAVSWIRANGPVDIYNIRYLIQRVFVP